MELYQMHCPKSNPNFRYMYITGKVVENMILHEIFRVVSRFPRYISCYVHTLQKIDFLWDSVVAGKKGLFIFPHVSG